MRIRRRHELPNIKLLGDFNELSISGHVEHQPVLRQDDDRGHVCEFMLTHHHQRVRALGAPALQRPDLRAARRALRRQLAARPSDRHQRPPRTAPLRHLAGPLPSIWIVAHCITTCSERTPTSRRSRNDLLYVLKGNDHLRRMEATKNGVAAPARAVKHTANAAHQEFGPFGPRWTARLPARISRSASGGTGPAKPYPTRPTGAGAPHSTSSHTTGHDMASHSQQHTEPATQHSILIAGTDQDRRTFLAAQLDADGHTIHEADRTAAVIAKLSSHAVDVLILGELERPIETTGLVRSVRAGRHRECIRGSR